MATALTFVAGSVDALILAATGRFASHMSGTTSGLARDLMREPFGFGMAAAGALLAFALGACVAGWLLADPAEDARRRHLPLLLAIEAVSLMAAGLLGRQSLGGPPLMLAIAVFAMGCQNATSSIGLGDRMRTTHVTGTLTDLGAAAGQLLRMGASASRHQSRLTMLRRSTARFAAFLLGGMSGGLAFLGTGPLGLLLPAGVLFACALSSRSLRDG